MAKSLNSISLAVLLLVLVMASTGFLKTEAGIDCPGGCSLAAQRTFLGECGSDPYTGTEADCCTCCKNTYKTSPNVPCWSAVEGTIKHCHCYKKV